MSQVTIITPPIADKTNSIDAGLVRLTELISKIDANIVDHGLLGGTFGYGANFENDTFMMHPYCWCDKPDCRWCYEDACGCANPEPEYYMDGVRISSDEYWSNSQRMVAKLPSDVAEYGTPLFKEAEKLFNESLDTRSKRLKIVNSNRVHTCEPAGMMANCERGLKSPPQTAPNFWHKKSNARVWWYKWIGRDMEMTEPVGVDWHSVFDDCFKSLKSS